MARTWSPPRGAEFVEENEDHVIVAVWLTHLGGHWCGYVARKNGTPISEDAPFHEGVTGQMGRNGLALIGFDTAHRGDVNIGPNGETGLNIHGGPVQAQWTKDAVFSHLRNVLNS